MTSTFQDTSSDCAICLAPLPSSPCLTLTCGHIYHKTCLIEQIQHSTPDPSHRLVFTGCLCAKCKSFCDHPDLQSVTRHSKQLFSKVDAIIQQLGNEHGHLDISERRRLYAFYLCSVCENPFFGGTVQCVNDSSRHEIPPNERICQTCALSITTTSCTQLSHTPYHVWKCRLCCSPSDRVCFGRTHFCESCHARFSNSDTSPKPCPGKPDCTHPMLPDVDRHVNALDVTGEQLLFCGLCNSNPDGADAGEDVNYSRNLLCNPSGELGLHGWTQLTCSQWSTENSEVPYPPFERNFVSTYALCYMVQATDITRFLQPTQSTADLTVSVSARYRARTDCPSVCSLEASVFDEELNEVFYVTTNNLEAPADCWEIARHTFGLGRGRYVVIGLKGKDQSFWAGLYGSKVTDCRISIILGDTSEQEVLNEEDVLVDDNCIRVVNKFRDQSFARQLGEETRLREEWRRMPRWEGEREREGRNGSSAWPQWWRSWR